ncbi:MAG: hypothetical protein LBG76_00090 [Treponema sp.]|nr:hypothetical protein [Treponema sp.]
MLVGRAASLLCFHASDTVNFKHITQIFFAANFCKELELMAKAEPFLQALRTLDPEAELCSEASSTSKITFYEDAVKVRMPYKGGSLLSTTTLRNLAGNDGLSVRRSLSKASFGDLLKPRTDKNSSFPP